MHPAVRQRSFKMNGRPGKVAHFHYSALYKVNQITNIFLPSKLRFGDKNGECASRLSLCQEKTSPLAGSDIRADLLREESRWF